MTTGHTPIEEYGFLSDRRGSALVSAEGSVDWLCLPDFDSAACMASVLGDEQHGRWLLRPADPRARATRRYLTDSLVLETTWECDGATATVVEFMPTGNRRSDLIRRVEGIRGEMSWRHEWCVRPWYGSRRPLVQLVEQRGRQALVAVDGPDRYELKGPHLAEPDAQGRLVGEFTVEAGECVEFDMVWHPSTMREPEPRTAADTLEATLAVDREWLVDCGYEGPWREMVRRSLLVLRQLTHQETGGVIAAPTTSLPETPGGSRNWDYRYVWLRDSALTIEALLRAGMTGKVSPWRDWLVRAVAGDPERMQIMYRLDAGHDLPERELDHLPGHGGASPVRIGNGAVDQRQSDVLGEVMLALHQARQAGIEEAPLSGALQVALVDDLARHWQEADYGIWEIRGPVRHFTHSRAMVWAAMDLAIRGVEAGDLPDGGDVETWRQVRDAVRTEINERGVCPRRGCFVQHYETDEVDASLLLLPHVGFCEPDDPRFEATVEAVEHDLLVDGLVLRYRTSSGVDGLEGEEHPFVLCTYWLASAYAAMGRLDDARRLVDDLVGLASPLGLHAEEVEASGRHHGNFPQAFSHLGLVMAAHDVRDAWIAAGREPWW